MQRYFRIVIDILLLAVLPVIVCYMLTGRLWHEWLGAGMCVGIVAHHVPNRRWFGSLFRAKRTWAKSLLDLVNVLLLLDILALLVSGLFLSKYVFGWTGLRALRVREMHEIHNCAGYWGLVLMGLHLGQHAQVLFGMMRLNRLPAIARLTFRFAVLALAAYGIYFFVQESLLGHLLCEEHFTMTESPPEGFLLGLSCVMVAFALLGYHLQRTCLKIGKRK